MHLAIVYHADGKITGYRKPYGRTFRKDALREYEAGDAEVVGMRHGKGASGDRMLAGRVFKARFNRALSAEAVMASSPGTPVLFPRTTSQR